MSPLPDACAAYSRHEDNKTYSSAQAPIIQLSRRLGIIGMHLWLLSKDDLITFVLPNTVFGISGAISGSSMTTTSSTRLKILAHIPLVVLFNWSNTVVFDIANQKDPHSVKEDTINKPWRVIPSGRLTPEDLRQAMFLVIPAVLALNHLMLGTGTETALLIILTWLYNDLGGSEKWIMRNSIIAIAFGVYNTGSIKAATALRANQPATLTDLGKIWVAIVSTIIFTTMSVQDLKDEKGDRARGRQTAPIVMGDVKARKFIAISVVLWSCFSTWFWDFKSISLLAVVCGMVVAWRCINLKSAGADRLTWELWAIWLGILYVLQCW